MSLFICSKCGFEAELYYRRKFNTAEDFVRFCVSRIFGLFEDIK